ncbi:hypothetical protein Sjap_024198 [Stephania japonica]|uniref:Uncharacterized protein n=1 Tax=Stephania japonica TaxID=461633 RepID=A0AAP0HNQ9_9MAGN
MGLYYVSRHWMLDSCPTKSHIYRIILDGDNHVLSLRSQFLTNQQGVRRAGRLAGAIRNAQTLKILVPIIETKVAFEALKALEDATQQFHNLKHLKLCSVLYKDCVCVLAVMHLLKISPNIEALDFQALLKFLTEAIVEYDSED